ncbi:hypothetical protein TthSNM17_23760 (plasmid) [Thermus thermophilus]|uniref:Uncharacterized protein n=1 Tax=Thermus thermophilus JL-18 TaxID=798128 RepID=H9ZVD1_THETH|nr:hypothetical protein TtJL18_2470 [Thermus thermophilus JL-18]BDG22714.1 hypothetical protein TthSNM17_23760 [Thermus thermophilus]BDG29817.1 hypothetical protein TthSNM76_20270 [Thermus thermophilus]BDG29952.1 hypothetical protein TthSNM76_21620 [Thermus thermophilus]
MAHLAPLRGRASLRLEAPGLFTQRLKAPGGLRKGVVPGLYRVVLHPRTDREGFLTGLYLAHAALLSPAPVGAVPGEPLRFLLLGEWLGALEGIGRVRVVLRDPEVPPFVVRFLLRRPHLAPAPGGLALVLGWVERGRLVGEVWVVLALGRELPIPFLPAS